MTLDETIKKAKVTAILFENEAREYTRRGGSFYEEQAKAFRESAIEFKQAAEWLEELKAYRDVHSTTLSIDIIRCNECKYEPICSHSVQHTTHEPTSVTIGYKSVDFCSYGERKESE